MRWISCPPLRVAEKPGGLRGHGFSRAVNAAKAVWTLASKGGFARLHFARMALILTCLTLLISASANATAQSAPQPPSAVPPPPQRFMVVLDAAHGGDDSGARLTSGQPEKTATLALSVRLRSLLAARGIQVVTTREADQSVDANTRAEISNRANAQACVTLHVTESGSGVHLFASSLTPVAPARFAAWKTAQAAWITRSLALAGVLNSALLQAGSTVTLGRTALPGVESMTCPAVAVEIAPERAADHKITAEPDDPAYQARIDTALAAALLEWKTEVRQP